MSNRLVQKLKDKKKELLFQYDKMQELKEKGWIKEYSDLYGDGDPKILFHHILKHYAFLLDPDDVTGLSKDEIRRKKLFNSFIRKIGPIFLSTKQIIEDRSELLGFPKGTVGPVQLPDEPLIFAPNHYFKDDALSTIIAADRHTYTFFGSLPRFFNYIDGPLLYKSGIIVVNRKVKDNRKKSMYKAQSILENGCSLIVFPEGVWNKTPDKMTIPLWNGIYRIAKNTGVKIVPVAHYILDATLTIPKSQNSIHTVIDDPIDISCLTESEALELIKERINYWTYLMMEKYGKTSRDEIIGKGVDQQSVWEDLLKKRIKTAGSYDSAIELNASYRPKNVILPECVFEPISKLEENCHNICDVQYAKKIVKERKQNDYQHRF